VLLEKTEVWNYSVLEISCCSLAFHLWHTTMVWTLSSDTVSKVHLK